MRSRSAFLKYPGLLVLAICAVWFGGSKPPSPPIVQEEGIKVLTFSAPITGGLEMTWETVDARIDVGTDDFIVYVSERQIPARTGWSAWRELGRTKETAFQTDGFWRNRDVRLRIAVDKGAIE